MLVRITSGFIKSSGWILLVAVVLIGAYLSLGRLFAYSVASNQQQIEAFLRDNGLEFVELGAITGDWQVYDPRIAITNITFKPDGETALEIDYLKIRLDSLRSLLSRAPIVTQIEVSGIRFTLERDENNIWVRGFRQRKGEFSFRYVLDSVPYLEELKISEIDIELIGPNQQMRLTSRPEEPWVIRGEEDIKAVSMPLYLERQLDDGAVQTNRISLSGYYQGDLRDSRFTAELYLDAPHIDLEDFLPATFIADKRLTSATLDTEIWLKIGPNEVDITGDVLITDVRLGDQNTVVSLLDKVKTQFRFQGESFTEGSLAIPAIRLEKDGFSFELDNLRVAISTTDDGYMLAGQLATLDVGDLIELINFAGEKSLVPERLSSAIAAVAPNGRLSDLFFTSTLDGDQRKIVSNLSDFSMDAYLGVPAIDRLNGFVSLRPGRGYLDIDNDEFQMNFKSMFSQAWPFDSGRGRIAYRVDNGSLSVSSGLIELTVGDLEAYGKLFVNLPSVREQQTWGLTLGVSNIELLEADRFVPNTVPLELVTWMKSAIQGGSSLETALTIHGSLFRGSPAVRKAHDLFFKVEDGVVDYQVGWPPLEALVATVHVNNYFVRSNNATGRIYDSSLSSGIVDVPISVLGKVDTVLVDAKGSGPFSDAIRFLKETPLAEMTSDIAAQWRGSGQVSSTIRLNLPLGARSEEELAPDVELVITGSTLVMPEFDLEVVNLNGTVTYNNELGLRSERFTGNSFDHPISGRIMSEILGSGGETIVEVDGAIDMAALYAWSDQPLLSRAEGVFTYQAAVHVPYGGGKDETYVEAYSDLVGVTLNLPHPLEKKDPNEARQFEYRQIFKEPGYRVELSLDDQIKASLKIENGVAVGGRIHFGEQPFGAVTYDAVRMTGHLNYLNVEDWMLLIDQLNEVSDVSLQDEISEHVETVTLNIDELMVFSLPLIDLDAIVTREDGFWLAQLSNEMLDGEVKVPDADSSPLDISLKRLSFEGEEDASDPFGEVNPLEIADIDFSTDLLLLDGEDYGSWSFKFRAGDEVAKFEELKATALGIQVLTGAQAQWRFKDGQHTSGFKGDILIDDLADALEKFGFASSVEGEGLKIKADINWAGSPAMIDVDDISGRVKIQEGKGRFVQAETGGALKLLGIFDFASLARRFRLDFSDVLEKGFEFSDISGVTTFNNGSIDVTEPIVIESPGGTFKVAGTVNLETRALDNDMIVTLPVGRTLPWYAAYSAIATGPLAGASVLLAQKVFENQIDQMSSAKYKISGTIEEPDIEFVSIFNDKVREAATR